MISVIEAEEMLAEAEKMNPGPWIPHSRNVALAARLITERTNEHDPDRSYVYGLLHDIGRRSGISHIRHLYDGFIFLKDRDWMAAEICLSHTFPNKNIHEYQGDFDLDKEKLDEIQTRIQQMEYTFYHKLILICDGYGFASGFVTWEKRWIEAAIRLGINDLTIEKWKKMYELKSEIESRYSCNIERILGL